MHLRPATPRSLPQISSYLPRCHVTNPTTTYLFPGRFSYPSNFRSTLLLMLQQRFYSPGIRIFVAVLDDGDEEWAAAEEEGERVVGHVIWERVGEGEVARGWRGDGWGMYLERTLLSLTSTYRTLFHLSPSTSPAHLLKFAQTFKDAYSAYPERWHVRSLDVDPAFQRRGIGAELLRWGMERAREEGVVVGLESSEVGRRLYEKVGFRVVGAREIGGVEVPVMIWDGRGG